MDIKDSYLHGTVGVVKSISVAADKLSYKLADVAGTTKTVTMPTATQSANGLLSSTDKKKLDSIIGPTLSIPYIVGPDTDTTKGTWTGSYSGITAYTDGLTIIYVPKVAGASTTTLNINGLGAKTCHYTGSSNLTTHYAVGTPILLTYVGGYWKRADYDSWTPYVAAYCSTAAATAAKTAACSSYVLTSKTYIHMLITTANTAQSALTMNINSKGAKPIYINGAASSASNYTLPAGTYIVYYDGTNFYFRTDGILPGTIEKSGEASNGIYYIEGTGSSDGVWLGDHSGISSYYKGLTIAYKIPRAGISSGTTLNINSLGAKAIKMNTSNLTTHFGAGVVVILVYNGTDFRVADYDSNTNTQIRIYRQTTGYNADYPLIVSRTATSSIGTSGTDGSYTAVYGVMWNDTTKVPTLNPSTGEIKAVKFTGALNGTANQVSNDLIIKLKSGTTEGTDLYTYNGSAAKTLDIKLGSNVTLTAEAGSLTITASDTKVTQTNTTSSASYRVLFSGNANDTTETTTARKSANLLFNPSTGNLTTTSLKLNGDIIVNDGTNNNRYIKWLYNNTDEYSWRIGYLGSGGANTNFLVFDSYREKQGWATALKFEHTTMIAHFGATVNAPTFKGNLDGTYVNKLTGYSKATSAANLAATDTLNIALGKLEYKAGTVYTWYKSVTEDDTDTLVNKWGEIVDFLDSVKEGTDITDEFVTRKTELTITGAKSFSTVVNITGTSSFSEGIRLHHCNNLSSLWFGAVNNSGYDPGMWGISVDTNGMRFRGTNSTTGNSASDYVNIIHGGNVGIGTTNPSQKLHVNGNILATKFITSGGTSSQFVKGDGSLDSNKYLINTHATHTSAYYRTTNVNGTNYAFWSHSSGAAFTIYAPSTAGTKGLILASNGSGAPVWKELSDIIAGSLKPTTILASGSNAFKYVKFASINLTLRYVGRYAVLKLAQFSTTSTNYANSCDVHVHCYQLDEMGIAPEYTIQTNNDDNLFEIIGIVNYSTTNSTLDLYVYGKGSTYKSINVTTIIGDNIISIGSNIDSLPTGARVTPTKMGHVAAANNGIFFINGTGSTAGTWLGSHSKISEYYTGLTIAYQIPIAGASTTTLNINSLGAKTCYINTSKLTTHYGVGCVAILVYDGTYFRAADYWDGNSYAYVRQYTTDSTDAEYPLLFRYNTVAPTANGYVTEYTRYDSGITINPSTNTITATLFKGSLKPFHVTTANYGESINYSSLLLQTIGSTVSGKSGYAGDNYGFPVSNNANGILWLGVHSSGYGGLLGISSNKNLYYRFISDKGYSTTANGGSWKQIAFTDSNITGNAASATTITIGTASGNVNYPVLFTTATSSSNTASVYIDADSKITFNPSTNTLTCTNLVGTVSNVKGSAASDNINRHIWFSHSSTETLRVYDDDFMYNPSTNTLAVGSITGSAGKLTATTIVSSKAFSLSNASWTDTGYTFASLASGTYAIQVTCGTLVASGIMSVYKNVTDTAGDEIPLHVYHDSTQPWRPYLRTSANKLLISSNDASATSRTVTIKIALIL